MIIQCNSCEKKFNVQDNAISEKGRLVQCSSCGNKWTQYPIVQNKGKVIKILNDQKNSKKIKKSKKIKPTKYKKKISEDPYSKEYLEKKHGIKIIDPTTSISNKNIKKIKVGYGFYSYVITILILLTTFFGILNYTGDILSSKFPFLENYIDRLYETLNYFWLIILNLVEGF